jgi:hypothetical protein
MGPMQPALCRGLALFKVSAGKVEHTFKTPLFELCAAAAVRLRSLAARAARAWLGSGFHVVHHHSLFSQPQATYICAASCVTSLCSVRHSGMRARKLNADGAAGPSAPRLDQLPAEARAGEQGARALPVDAGAAALCTQGARRAFDVGCLWFQQVLQACAVHLANARCGPYGGLRQVFLLPTVCRRALHLST